MTLTQMYTGVDYYDAAYKRTGKELSLIIVGVTALFALMAFRAFRSGSRLDYLLGAVQCVGLLLLLMTNFRTFALGLLLVTALAYLASQIVTGARVISRVLPLAGFSLIVLALLV